MKKIVSVLVLALGLSHLSYGLEDCDHYLTTHRKFYELARTSKKADLMSGAGTGGIVGGGIFGPVGTVIGAAIGAITYEVSGRSTRKEYRKKAIFFKNKYHKCLMRNQEAQLKKMSEVDARLAKLLSNESV